MGNMIFIQNWLTQRSFQVEQSFTSIFNEHHAVLFTKRKSLNLAFLYVSAKESGTENGKYCVDTIGVLRKCDYMSATEWAHEYPHL